MDNRELWPFLFVVGVLIFNWPFLDIFGLALPYYLFGIWGSFIILIGLLISTVSKSRKKKSKIV